mmetsp:Transcript_27671/g.66556  ORF Transcript_27671/g.66556 Transcript_27671/m.66556 type:complete len:571 (+) Transcript_27671:82-1794(+)
MMIGSTTATATKKQRRMLALGSILLVSSLLSSTVVLSQEEDYTWDFDGCSIDDYYVSLGGGFNSVPPTSWTRDELQTLLQATHRNTLPLTRIGDPGIDDVWAALIDLDRGTTPDTVRLLYTSTQIDAIPFGQRTWVKEQIWPVDRGIDLEADAPDLSDIHNIRPTSVLSDIVRGDSLFGECGVLVKDVSTCQQPAEGSADDTCICDRGSGTGVYTPPTASRGEIARALLYMDLRYDGSEALTKDLQLTDCPFAFPDTGMGYLSQLITWHLDDPPSQEEIERNTQACRRWQGNRNPFVDFPELAVALHYEPLELPEVGERQIYEACESIPTSSPTARPNDCDAIASPGDVYVWLLNSQNPDVVGLYTFQNLPPGFELYMTDNPWNGTMFLEQNNGNDGTLLFTVPESGLPGGTAWGYNDPALLFSSDQYWTLTQGDFSLNDEDGEAIFLYCINAEGEQKPLLSFSYGATLDATEGLDVYEENETSFPTSLGEIGLQDIIPLSKNNLFNSTGAGGIADNALKIAVRDPINWAGSNTSRFGVEGSGNSAAPCFFSFEKIGLAAATISSIFVFI